MVEMVESFITALLDARTTAVSKTVPFRSSLVLRRKLKLLLLEKTPYVESLSTRQKEL
jgi:hypothetical protein